MTKESLTSLTALQLGRAIKAGETTAIEATQAILNNVKIKDKLNNCYITVDEEKAIEQAKRIQQAIMKGELTGPLAGVPVAVKDNICTEGLRTTCGSQMLDQFVPPYSATVMEHLKQAGMILIGKTNMDEFAMGSTTETSYYGATPNPLDRSRVAGGSSGGSAAAVAAAECYIALGSDTGGSVRQPASHCGVVGIKPTYGLVSRYGLVAYASSMDQIGPLGKDVADCAAMMKVIIGKDDKDSTSVDLPTSISGKLIGTEDAFSDFFLSKSNCRNILAPVTEEKECASLQYIQGLRIGIPEEYFSDTLDVEIKTCVIETARKLEDAGAIVEYFSLDSMEYVVPVYYILADAEASSNLSRFDGVRYGYRTETYGDLHQMYKKSRGEGFGKEVKNRILAGTFVLSAGYYEDYYRKAMQVRSLICESFQRAFEKYDVIMGPVAPSTAPILGESLKNPMQMYLADVYTVPANLAGLPAMSLPAGKDKQGMPIGVQLMTNRFEDDKLIRVGHALETILQQTGREDRS